VCMAEKRFISWHGKSDTRTYKSWEHMKGRCLNPRDKSYKDYGGRGILVCDDWLKFENFWRDMGERPSGTTLERHNVNGNYEPSNCCWGTLSQQALNRRPRPRMADLTAEIEQLRKRLRLAEDFIPAHQVAMYVEMWRKREATS
jgi:hypothetical protein